MRALFTFTGGTGHFLPLLPIARALAGRGHEVRFSCQSAMVASVRAAGFTATVSGGDTLLSTDSRRPPAAVDRAHEKQVVREFFGYRVASVRATRLVAIAGAWRPDVIVRDEVDFGAAVAAERLGITHVAVVVLAADGLIGPAMPAESLDRVRAEHGLPADPTLAMLHRHLTLVPVPPSFRDPADPLPATARHLRPAVFAEPPTPQRRPRIFCTLGTVFPQESGDLFGRVLAGLCTLDADVTVTVGHALDPAELGPRPAHVRVERFLPLSDVLRATDLVVSHAGSGTVVAALACGIPVVVLPLGADQPWNADRCTALGVGQVLDPMTVTADEVAGAAQQVLTDRRYRIAARSIHDEVAALPTAEDAAGWIEAQPGSVRP